jgi:hypothetical protein
MSFVSSSDTGLTALNTVLAEEANRINADIHKRTLHVSPWIDLIKKSAFPEGMGYQLTTLVYDRAIPTSASSGNAFGLNWHEIGIVESSNTFNTSLATGRNALAGATKQLAGPSGGDTDLDGDFDSSDGNSGDIRSFINFSKQLKQYKLKRAVVESPRLSLEDLRFAAHRQEQLRAVMDLMTEATRYSWENRNRDEYDRLAANLVPCLATSTPIVQTIDVSASTKFEGTQTVDVDLNNDFVSSGVDVDYTPVANISNAVLDKVYQRLVRAGAGMTAYGRENGRPVFGLVLSSEASYKLQTEAGFRDDFRYSSSKVAELLQPLGVERSQRGFYHLIDDLVPRYTVSSGTLTRVQPYTVSGGIVTDNASYETATIEAAYVIHADVMECQIPNPFAGAGAVKFDPITYSGIFKWLNIQDEVRNPDGTQGFFRGVLSSASKPIHTSFGFVILFDRTSSTPAGV